MKFNCSTIINAPLEKVAAGFISEEIMKESQEGFISKEYLNGVPWDAGSTSKLLYKNLELSETILINKLPAEFKALYEHKNMVNTMHCTFTAIDASTTQLVQVIHYSEFIGFLPKLMSRLFPGMFRKQVQKWLDKFKEAVEKKQDIQ